MYVIDCTYNPYSIYVFVTLLTFLFQKLGYCQGMSSLAALLLTYLNEEDAFWGMVTLIGDQKYAMHGEFHEFHPKRTAVRKFECILRHKQSFFRLQLI